jgi:hypothetical protein
MLTAAVQQKSTIWKKCVSNYEIAAQAIDLQATILMSYIRHRSSAPVAAGLG